LAAEREEELMRISSLAPATLAALAALAIAACGGSGSPSAGATSTDATKATAGTGTKAGSPVVTVTKTETATVSASSSTSAGPPPCRAAGLALSFLGQQGATGHGELGFSLRNTASTSCGTLGYPGVQFLDRSGGDLPTIPTHTTRDFFGTAPVAMLIVAPGRSVSFRLGVTHGIGSSTGCTMAFGLRVIPPNDTATLRVSIPDRASECGTTTVSPLRPGQTAYP